MSVGCGTFQKTRRKARKGRNPQTGEAIRIKAQNCREIQGREETQRGRLDLKDFLEGAVYPVYG